MTSVVAESEIALKITLLAFRIQKKNKNKLISEPEFFTQFLREINDSKIFLKNHFFTADFLSEFVTLSHSLCQYESMSYMPDDTVPLYEETKINIKKKVLQLNNILIQNKFHLTEDFTEDKWRKLIGMFDVFCEWCENTQYFLATDADKKRYLEESPLISLAYLVDV